MKKSVPLSSRTKRRKMKEELDYFNLLPNTYDHDIPEKLFLESNLLNEIPMSDSNSHNYQDNLSFTTSDRLSEELNESQNYDFYKIDSPPIDTSDTDDSNNLLSSTPFVINNELAQWAILYNTSHTSLDNLLNILRKHKCFITLPKRTKTLLQTKPISIENMRVVNPGINQQENIKAVQNMKYLIETQWSHEISSNALKDITQKKWNKPAILPLTSDIKLFRNHLLKIENESYNKLKVNPENLHTYRDLQDSILTQLILLNRRRSGEIQRIHLDTYTNSISEISQEEIVQALSPMETELTKSFKRIVIRGKRGRGVPVLFTPHLQKRLQYLLQLRKIVSFINKDNPYLFPLTQSPNNCVRASDIIRKFGDECGAQHPENITSTRLRKHVTTVTQLLNLSEGDIEQLSIFMGHSVNMHKEYYRLSDNAFQVAKVSKLLLMMEKGQGNEYRGKSLDEIDIDVDELLSGEEDSTDEENEIDINQTTALKTIKFVLGRSMTGVVDSVDE